MLVSSPIGNTLGGWRGSFRRENRAPGQGLGSQRHHQDSISAIGIIPRDPLSMCENLCPRCACVCCTRLHEHTLKYVFITLNPFLPAQPSITALPHLGRGSGRRKKNPVGLRLSLRSRAGGRVPVLLLLQRCASGTLGVRRGDPEE